MNSYKNGRGNTHIHFIGRYLSLLRIIFCSSHVWHNSGSGCSTGSGRAGPAAEAVAATKGAATDCCMIVAEASPDTESDAVCIIILGDVTRGSCGHSVWWANLLEQQLVITVPPVRQATWNYHYIDLLNSTKLNLISLRATQNPKIIISKATRNY